MPSVLIETGFLTNPQEEDYLHTELGKDDIALSIFVAFVVIHIVVLSNKP